jgi:hypothetical protein
MLTFPKRPRRDQTIAADRKLWTNRCRQYRVALSVISTRIGCITQPSPLSQSVFVYLLPKRVRVGASLSILED